MNKKEIDDYIYKLKVGLILCDVLKESFEKRNVSMTMEEELKYWTEAGAYMLYHAEDYI